jgi:hypothetical protein
MTVTPSQNQYKFFDRSPESCKGAIKSLFFTWIYQFYFAVFTAFNVMIQGLNPNEKILKRFSRPQTQNCDCFKDVMLQNCKVISDSLNNSWTSLIPTNTLTTTIVQPLLFFVGQYTCFLPSDSEAVGTSCSTCITISHIGHG